MHRQFTMTFPELIGLTGSVQNHHLSWWNVKTGLLLDTQTFFKKCTQLQPVFFKGLHVWANGYVLFLFRKAALSRPKHLSVMLPHLNKTQELQLRVLLFHRKRIQRNNTKYLQHKKRNYDMTPPTTTSTVYSMVSCMVVIAFSMETSWLTSACSLRLLSRTLLEIRVLWKGLPKFSTSHNNSVSAG